jgi:hypothetical protein
VSVCLCVRVFLVGLTIVVFLVVALLGFVVVGGLVFELVRLFLN